MRYVAAYLLAVLGGKTSPSQNDVEKILSVVGIEVDAEKVEMVISALDGKSIEEVIAAGKEKLASMPAGDCVVPVAAAAAAPGAAVEEAKEEKNPAKEESESEDEDMGFGLFD